MFWVPKVCQCSPQLDANIMYSIDSAMEQQDARADVRKQSRGPLQGRRDGPGTLTLSFLEDVERSSEPRLL